MENLMVPFFNLSWEQNLLKIIKDKQGKDILLVKKITETLYSLEKKYLFWSQLNRQEKIQVIGEHLMALEE